MKNFVKKHNNAMGKMMKAIIRLLKHRNKSDTKCILTLSILENDIHAYIYSYKPEYFVGFKLPYTLAAHFQSMAE